VDSQWRTAKAVIRGQAKLQGYPGAVQSGEKFTVTLKETAPVLCADEVTEDYLVTIESLYPLGCQNITMRNYMNEPVKVILVPGWPGKTRMALEFWNNVDKASFSFFPSSALESSLLSHAPSSTSM
jgi:hypothetical protein